MYRWVFNLNYSFGFWIPLFSFEFVLDDVELPDAEFCVWLLVVKGMKPAGLVDGLNVFLVVSPCVILFVLGTDFTVDNDVDAVSLAKGTVIEFFKIFFELVAWLFCLFVFVFSACSVLFTWPVRRN